MTIFHRFCAVFPVFLLLILAACTATTQNTWKPSNQPVDQSAAALPPATSGQPAVKVAILLPLSGSNGAVGHSMLQAAQLAVFDVGYDNFELISKDTQGTSAGAAAAATTALSEGAQLIIGPLLSDEVRGVKSAIAGRNVNMLAFSTDWTLSGGNTYIMGFLPFGQVERIARYSASKGLKRAAVAAGADTYGTSVSNKFEAEAQKNGIAISRALSDPSTYDSVFIPAGGSALDNILMRVTNTSARKLGTGLWDDARVAANPKLNGAWFAAPSPNARADFENRYQTTYGTRPVRLATLAYDATALAAALSKSGGFGIDSLTHPSGFAGVDGIIRFNKSGLVERGMAVLEIQNGRIVEIDPAPSSF